MAVKGIHGVEADHEVPQAKVAITGPAEVAPVTSCSAEVGCPSIRQWSMKRSLLSASSDSSTDDHLAAKPTGVSWPDFMAEL